MAVKDAPAAPPDFSIRTMLRDILPRFARDAFGPALMFYVAWQTLGLVGGIVIATATSVLLWYLNHRRGVQGVLPRISLAVVFVQAAVGLISGSAEWYLAQPAIVGMLVGIGFMISAVVGRPVGALIAADLYTVPASVRSSPDFRHAFRLVTLVWAAYLFGRAALRLAVLAVSTVEVFLLFTAVSGAPVMVVLITWSGWYAYRVMSRDPTSAATAGAILAGTIADAAEIPED
jgi:intracellular septation protein A